MSTPNAKNTNGCWSGFCITGDCDGIHHVDATGYTWAEVHTASLATDTAFRPTPPSLAILDPTVVPTVRLLLGLLGDACHRADGDAAVQLVYLLDDVAGTKWTVALVNYLVSCGLRRLATSGGV